MENNENKRPPVRYIRLLSYDNACKVIKFINRNDTGKLEDDYANITTGGVHTQVKDENWASVLEFMNTMEGKPRYEVCVVPPHEVEKEILKNAERVIKELKKHGAIK